MDIKLIREAVIAHRGGLENASNGEIMTIWRSLPADVREKYLQGVKQQKPAVAKQKAE